jgi:hypothetical protein
MHRRPTPSPADMSRVKDRAREMADLTGRSILFMGLLGGFFLAVVALLHAL